jgi:hypothetical protein
MKRDDKEGSGFLIELSMRCIAIICTLLFASLSLYGCGTSGQAIIDTFRVAFPARGGDPGAFLSPEFAYLRLVNEGRVGYLARGAVEQSPDGAVEVWYSADREVLKIQNGRILAALGTSTEWRGVSNSSIPSWESVVQKGAQSWTRVRDVMPGYRLGVVDRLTVEHIPPPTRVSFIGMNLAELTWFSEIQQQSTTRRSDLDLPKSIYAVDLTQPQAPVVYSEQCLDIKLCISWQRWPVPTPSKAR